MKNKPDFSVSFWLFLFLVIIVSFSYFNQNKTTGPKNYNYSDFLENVKKGEVTSVSVSRTEEGLILVDGTAKDGSKFTTTSPTDDPVFYKTLHDNAVKIVAKLPGSTAGRIFKSFLIFWGPIILLIVFWIFIMNRSQGGGGGAMSFGKSKAKLAEVGGKITFADVAGVDEAKEELQEVVLFLKEPKKFTNLGGKMPKGLLLIGPPGTGKTLIARAIAGEAGVPFFTISGSDFVEMFVGVGAARVRDLFDQGKKNAPCIIFIDEIDAVGRHRGAGLGGGHDEREQTLNALLVEMDGFETNTGVIIVAATNRPDVLDPALLRPGRFDRQVGVEIPDIKGREAILKIHAKNVKFDKDIDFSVIAKRTSGMAGAELANIINEAALLAARKNKPAVTMDELHTAIERVHLGLEKKSRVRSEEQNKVAAIHEAGHAIVAYSLSSNYALHKISIIPRTGGAGGVTWFLPKEDDKLPTKTEMVNRIAIGMGGRSAEEIILKNITAGASMDIKQATAMAHAMVCVYGMSDKLGPITYGQSDQEVFIGKSFMREQNFSDKTAQIIDEEIKKIIEEAHENARSIISNNIKLMNEVTKQLLEKETLELEDFEKIVKEMKLNVKKKKSV